MMTKYKVGDIIHSPSGRTYLIIFNGEIMYHVKHGELVVTFSHYYVDTYWTSDEDLQRQQNIKWKTINAPTLWQRSLNMSRVRLVEARTHWRYIRTPAVIALVVTSLTILLVSFLKQ